MTNNEDKCQNEKCGKVGDHTTSEPNLHCTKCGVHISSDPKKTLPIGHRIIGGKDNAVWTSYSVAWKLIYQ